MTEKYSETLIRYTLVPAIDILRTIATPIASAYWFVQDNLKKGVKNLSVEVRKNVHDNLKKDLYDLGAEVRKNGVVDLEGNLQ